MVTDPLFSIRNLYCAYNSGQPVLYIPHLDVWRGGITCVLGASGVGKSTLIEALGLMNTTILPDSDSKVLFFSDNQDEPIDLARIWSSGNQALSCFRHRHYSFIFQQTNLMPNLSAGENMCISMLIGGQTLDEARSKITEAMKLLSLDESLFDRPAMHLSGGQRQRATFVRAITASFEVLFGDEPTGNLDKATACKLMEVLRSTLKDSNRSAIIVTHDIDLAFRFADRLLVLTHVAGRQYGYFSQEHQLFRMKDEWLDQHNQPVQSPQNWVDQLLSAAQPY